MWIVTGGAGLIGSAVVWQWNKCGIDDILIVDHLGESDKWKNLRALRYRDYLEKEQFIELLTAGGFDNTPIEGIMHLGACSSTTERDATYLVHNNFQYGKGDSIINGQSIDVWVDSLDDAYAWRDKYGDYVYIKIFKAKG